jgi:predicted phosphohydrolase
MNSRLEINLMIAVLDQLESGIVPFPSALGDMRGKSIIACVREHLSKMTEEEQRVAKRKFRKLHRKASAELRKKKTRTTRMNEMHISTDGSRKPTLRAHEHRNIAVFNKFLRRAAEEKP